MFEDPKARTHLRANIQIIVLPHERIGCVALPKGSDGPVSGDNAQIRGVLRMTQMGDDQARCWVTYWQNQCQPMSSTLHRNFCATSLKHFKILQLPLFQLSVCGTQIMGAILLHGVDARDCIPMDMANSRIHAILVQKLAKKGNLLWSGMPKCARGARKSTQIQVDARGQNGEQISKQANKHANKLTTPLGQETLQEQTRNGHRCFFISRNPIRHL